MFDFGTIFSQGFEIFFTYLAQFSPEKIGINLLDVIIVFVIFFYAYEGYVLGFLLATVDLFSFIGSFILALKLYPLVATVFVSLFGLPVGFANALAFFFVAFLSEILLTMLGRRVYRLIPKPQLSEAFSKVYIRSNHWLGVLPGFVSAFIILAFILTVIISLPSSPVIKDLVTESTIGSRLLGSTSFFEKRLNNIFGGALDETITFLTVKPSSQETVDLRGSVLDGKIDAEAEQEMLTLVNAERKKAGLALLIFSKDLRDVARLHSQDMFTRGYFSHYTPEGRSPFDRMQAAGIMYTFAGENLALAPSTKLAMQGLMDSPGHKANILNPNFKQIGIGVIDGGMYGKMYSQEFTD